MSNSIYANLSRQNALMSEIRLIANNIANSSTTGFRSESVIFSEYVAELGGTPDVLSMGRVHAKSTDLNQGGHTMTGGTLDFAINGDGFFAVETPVGIQLTRAGSFLPNQENELVTPDGFRVLDVGQAPIFIPPDSGDISVASDGTVSADGAAISQIGIFLPSNILDLKRQDGVRFETTSDLVGSESATVAQGFLESSNVDPIGQISRLIEVQRSYEMGQSFLESEDERARSILQLIQR